MPRPTTTATTTIQCADDTIAAQFNSTVVEMVNTTAKAAVRSIAEASHPEWTGLGVEWLRSLLGKREWRIDCMDIYIRL